MDTRCSHLMCQIKGTDVNGGNILRYITINEQNEMAVMCSGLMVNYVFTEAVLVVVPSYRVNFILKTGS